MSNFCKYVFLLVFLIGVSACEDDLELPDNTVEFESDQLGFGADESELTININFSREASDEGTIEIIAVPTGVEYGIHFTTEPAMIDNQMSIPVSAGATGVSFKVIKSEGAAFIGDEQLKFSLSSNLETLIISGNGELFLTFAEIIAELGSIAPNVGGESQPNKVFIDLSANRQYFLSRSDWDLGFYTVGGEFRVIHNTSSGMLVRALNSSDLGSVTASDTVGFGAQLSLEAIFAAVMGPPPAWVSEAINWFDDSAGDLSATAIAEVSATDVDNKVYIVNRGKNPDGTERGWKKIRVIRNGNGYTLQHADINSSSDNIASINIEKDDAYLFNYIKFESGLVEAEPKKKQWDIAFTVFTNSFSLGPGVTIPFEFKDFVIQNRNGVETAQVMTANISFDNFTQADISGLTFTTSQKGIGSSWRSIPSNSATPPSLNSDRFYVIKDPDGNIYKLRFTALTKSGERGNPAFEFALVQKAG